MRSPLRLRLPEPPTAFRHGPFAENAFRSHSRSERVTSLLGIALAVTFSICLVTGLISHQLQEPIDDGTGWLAWPTGPAWGYRLTQGVHVASGLASIPLLLAKLWSVYPKLFRWPPAVDVADALGRLSLAVLVGSAIFQLLTGLLDIAHWYSVMPFFFPDAHYGTAWVASGAIAIHVGTKLPVVRRALAGGSAEHRPGPQSVPSASQSTDAGSAAAPRRGGDDEGADGQDRSDLDGASPAALGPEGGRAPGLDRRGFLGGVALATGAVTVTTIGQSVPILSGLAVLAPRDPRVGPQGLPVNKTAESARVLESANAADYALLVVGPGQVSLSLADLRALPQHSVELPIACVEGWSATGHWTGVRMRDLLLLAGFDPADDNDRSFVRVESLQRRGRYRASSLPSRFAADPRTLLALQLGDEPLHLQHGYPARLIAPNRPGVLQTKWVSTVTVLPRGAS
ncbi:MAG: molybdopterin-dependent oxidoreductase [Actinomycetales bacterium]